MGGYWTYSLQDSNRQYFRGGSISVLYNTKLESSSNIECAVYFSGAKFGRGPMHCSPLHLSHKPSNGPPPAVTCSENVARLPFFSCVTLNSATVLGSLPGSMGRMNHYSRWST
ncbi:hypothetical protein MPTK1_7g05540 [Marchantia polymorpha subsp. ruderalis]|uniref:Uncharacterized protein n=2 Tax=Marchantia polymorpha TaxID=3197 RepID=A0AAF6BWF6_MARPO|nr:hypothetical protein MARPO_0057s0116 [Marchantia polymorpha]BBN16340.1 hypothetical protein Mp_7g05540 [Marchantia polymorpha subsp. ruderalis]|eukprot:PTQ37515.1 hypothetical protein MARPO_0057s0116 [Marchantia polymorpha]